MKKLKVYGWYGFRARQTREIVAAHSVAEVLRITGPRWLTRDEIVVTGNAHEIETAMRKPGTVFFHYNDDRSNAFIEATSPR